MVATKAKDPRRVNDYWTRKAKAEHFPARSVYKLEEVDRKYGLLRPGYRVLDLGAAPGSWLIYAAERVGPTGLAVGVDFREPDRLVSSNIRFIQADVFDLSVEQLGEAESFDVVLSDLAPATSGIKTTDQARSLELCRAALRIAHLLLKNGGAFLFKIFQGPDSDDFFNEVKADFTVVRRVKPKSSRSFSPEIFGLGMGFQRKSR